MTAPALPLGTEPRAEAARRRPPGSALALSAFFTAAALQAWAAKARNGRDLGVLLDAGGRALRGEALYRLSDGHWCFKYSPPAALIFAPVSLLPRPLASLALALGSAAALVVILLWAADRVAARDRPLTHLLVVALSVPYTLHLLALGQNDALLVVLAVAGEAVAPRRPVLSGALLAVACVFKPPFLLLLLLPVAWREGRRVAGFLAALAAAAAATALRYGAGGLWGELRAWRALLAATTPRLLCDEQNQSAWAVACTYLASPADGARYRMAVAGLSLALVAAAGGLALLAARGRHGRFALFAAALYVTAPLSPLGWRANLVAAIPLLYVLVENARRAASRSVRRLSAATIAGVLAVQLASYDVTGARLFFLLLRHRHYALACAAAVLAALAGAAVEARRAAAGTAAGAARIGDHR